MSATLTETTTTTRTVSLTLDGREAKFDVPQDADNATIMRAAQEVASAEFGRTAPLDGFMVDAASPTLTIVRPKVPFGA